MRLEINNTTKQKIKVKILKQAGEIFSQKMKIGDKAVSVAFVSGARMKELNKRYRGQNKITDILSFTPTPIIPKHKVANKGDLVRGAKFKNSKNKPVMWGCTGEAGDFGELIICHSQIKRQAKKFHRALDYELLFIFIHGLLHLAGYDDATGKGREEMIVLGERLCKEVITI